MRPIVLFLIAFLIVATADEGAGKPMDVINSAIIMGQIKNNASVVYDRVTVIGDLDISTLDVPVRPVARSEIDIKVLSLSKNQSKVISPIKITNSVIKGNINFNDTFFQEPVDFEDTDFSGTVYLDGSQFDRGANFKFADFPLMTVFNGAQFSNYANFLGTHFGSSSFFGVRFEEGTDFSFSRFDDSASFAYSQFNNSSYFSHAAFKEPADFSNAKFRSQAVFDNAKFGDDADFTDAQFKTLSADFIGAKFRREVDFRGATFEGVKNIQGELNLTDVDFSGKFNVRWDTIKNILICNGPVYIALIKSFKDLEQFDDANSCYYQYREWSQRLKPFGLSKVWDYLAWATCGYGVSWLNTILFALMVSVLFTLMYSARTWYTTSTRPDYGELFWLSIIVLTSAPKEMFPSGMAKFEELAKEHWYLTFIERIIGWALLVVMINVLIRLTMRY
ncbi:MAG: pentapeptide repeat-containing protein [Methanotrichaceae archaeon]